MNADAPPLQWSPEPVVTSAQQSTWRLNTPPAALFERLSEQFACRPEFISQQLIFCEVQAGWWVYQRLERQHWLNFYPRQSAQARNASDTLLGQQVMSMEQPGQQLKIYQRKTSARQFLRFLMLRFKQRIRSIEYFTDSDIHLALGHPTANLFIRQQGAISYLVWSQVDE